MLRWLLHPDRWPAVVLHLLLDGRWSGRRLQGRGRCMVATVGGAGLAGQLLQVGELGVGFIVGTERAVL